MRALLLIACLKPARAKATNWVVQFRFRQIGDEVLDTNRQVADAATDRVEDSIGDGCLDACGAKHADPFDSARQIRIVVLPQNPVRA